MTIAARELRVERWTPASRLGAMLAAAAGVALATFPFWAPSDIMRLVVEFACWRSRRCGICWRAMAA